MSPLTSPQKRIGQHGSQINNTRRNNNSRLLLNQYRVLSIQSINNRSNHHNDDAVLRVCLFYIRNVHDICVRNDRNNYKEVPCTHACAACQQNKEKEFKTI